MTHERESVLPDVLFFIALAILAWQLGGVLLNQADLAGRAIGFPYPLDYSEGPVLEQAVRLAQGLPIYRAPATLQTPPYTLANEPPLFPLIQGLFAHTGAANLASFSAGRVMSIGSLVVAAILIALILWTLTRQVIAALVGGALLFVFPHTALWSMFAHADSLALSLSLAGLLIVLRRPMGWIGVLLGAVLFTAATFTKHSFAIAGPLTSILWLLQTRGRPVGVRQSLKLGLATAALSLIVFALLNQASDGGFAFSLTAGNPNAFETSLVIGPLINLGVHAGLLLIAGALYLVVERLDVPTPAWSFVAAYLLAAGIATVWTISISAGRTGTNINDLFELVAALCVLIGAMLAWAGKQFWLKIGVIALIAFQLGSLGEWMQAEYQPWLSEKLSNRRDIAQLDALIRESNGHVLVDEWSGLLVRNGLPIPIQPMEFTQLKAAGLWSDAELIDRIRRKEFSAVLFYEPTRQRMISVRWTPEVRQAVYDAYERDTSLIDTLVYRPKP